MDIVRAFEVKFVVKIQKKREVAIMARHGENIRKRKDGRWEARYLIYSREKGKKQYRSVYGRTYEEAKERVTAERNGLGGHLKGLLTRKAAAQEKIFFADMAEKWLLEVKDTKKLSTYAKYSLIYQVYLKETLQETELSKITETLVGEKISDPLSESIKKSIYCVLNQVLKYASRNYYIIIPSIKRPVFYMRKKTVSVFSWKEQALLFSVLRQEPDIFKTAVLLCLYTGLRLGEVCALKWEDVDFGNRLIVVRRTVQRLYVEGYATKTALLESEPKSAHSRREIPLSAPAVDLLVRIQNQQEYVFGRDKPLEPRTLQYHFKKLLKESMLPHKNFHALRHTFSTNCIEKGTDVKSLSEILGHSDVQITLNRYVHPSMDTKRRYLDVLSAFYGQIHGQDD